MEKCDKEMKEFINHLKPEIEEYFEKNFKSLEAIGFRIKEKEDNQISYSFKVKIGNQKYIHFNIKKGPQEEIKIREIIFGKKLFDEN